jgi:hypothetical protein
MREIGLGDHVGLERWGGEKWEGLVGRGVLEWCRASGLAPGKRQQRLPHSKAFGGACSERAW